MTTTMKSNSSQDKVDTIAQIIAMRIDDLLLELDVPLFKSGNKLVGCCPIHGGKKMSSFNLWPEGHTVAGLWKCRSHHCEDTFKWTILGFVRGVLSHRKYGWQKKGDKLVSFDETIKWCCDFIGQDAKDIKVDKAELERRRFAAQIANINKAPVKPEGITRSQVRDSLIIPADFFVKRGYSPEVLNKFDVGLCDKQGREMFSRIVVPVYDNSRSLMVGCTGRSIYDECSKCGCYHAPGSPCPSEEYRWQYSKWKNSKSLNAASYLYNYWNAKKVIQETGVVVLVEGPADLWRLEENGIHNGLALFGCELTDEQQVLLESSGAMSVIILLDNDEPGRQATQAIKKSLERAYNVFTPQYSGKDVGALNATKVREEILPIVEQVQKKNKSYF